MKKILLFAFLLGILIFSNIGLSSPVINEIKFNPSSEIWVEESLEMSVNCSGIYVSAAFIGNSGYTIYVENFTLQNGLYKARIDSLYWRNRQETFDVIVNCSDGNETSQSIASLKVSKFNVEISGIYPSTIYLGDMIEIGVLVKKDNQPINSSDVKFNITLDNNPQQPEIRPPYDPNGGWIIFFNSSEIRNLIGTHNLKINVAYDRVNSTVTASFIINEPVQFSILSLSKSWIKPNDTITITLQALDKGSIIPLTKENLAIWFDSTPADIVSISPSGNLFSVTILSPNLPSGSYTLKAFLSYKNYNYTSSSTVSYIVAINGKFVDENDKAIPTRLSFFSNGIEKLRLYTDAAGSYSGSLPPGTYDIEIVFPQSTLRLYDVEIKSFEDPIRYYYFGSLDLEGINVAGLFVYEVALPYYKASIEMKYDEKNVANENLIKVYKCEDWNSGKKECYGRWNEAIAIVDKIRNVVYVNTTSLSAYAIGTLKKLSIDFNLNKETFYLKDLVRLRGMVLDEYRNPVSNVSISMKIKNTNISAKTFSDNNGLFTLEFLSPEKEGNYSLILTAEKHPFLSFNSSFELKVVKSKEVSIVFPDTIRLKQGENLTQELSIVNIGQTELYNLNISLTGIPSEYYSLTQEIGKLEVGEERKIVIFFAVPKNASTGTSSASLKVFNNEISKEKIFGFTILEKNQTVETKPPSTGLFGKIALPQISLEPIHLLIFALASFSSAFLLKRRKIKNQVRNEIKNFLFELKEHLKTKEKALAQPQENETEKIEEKGIG
jgi:hypothetical protein